MPTSVADASGLPLLKSPKVRALGSARSGKNELLRSYVRTQETYLASYASEGKAVMASWALEPSSLSAQEHGVSSLRDVEIESGFGTPLLKPRARIIQPVAAQKRDSEELQEKRPGNRTNKPQNGVSTHDKTSAPVTHLSTRTGAPRGGWDRNSEPPSEIQETSSVPKQVVLDLAHSRAKTRANSKHAITTKRSTTEDDEEHRARLAERKERRRAKRAIVEPRPKPPGGISGDDSDRAPQTPRRASKGKKAKGLNIPAGLALLHGFSAQNVGKNRLTIRPDPLVGVFNKGKASAKASIMQDKATKSAQRVKVFSEHSFLNKSHMRRPSPASLQYSCDEEGNSAIEDIPRTANTRTGEACQFESAGRKRARSVSDAPSSSDGASEQQDLQPVSSPAKKRGRTRHAESPVWDIELASGVLPSNANDSCTPVATEIAKVASTVVMDVREDTAKWTAVAPIRTLESNPASSVDRAKPSQKTPSEVSSIAPSQSASQAPARRLDPRLEATSTVMFSKYFSAPAHTVTTVETTALQDAPAMSPFQLPHNGEQSSVGSAIEARIGFPVPHSQPGCTTTFDLHLPLGPTTPHCHTGIAGIAGHEEPLDCSDTDGMLLPNPSLALQSGSVLSPLSGPPSPAGSHPPSPGSRVSFFVSHDPPTSDKQKSRHSRKTLRQRRRHWPDSPSHSRSAAYTFAARPEPHHMLAALKTEAGLGFRLDDSAVAEGLGAYDLEPCCLPDDSSSLGRWADISRNSATFLGFDDVLDDSLTSHDVPLPAEYEVPFPTILGEGDSMLLRHDNCNSGSSLLDAPHQEQYEPYDMEVYLEGQPDNFTGDLPDSTYYDAEAAVIDAHSESLVLAGANSSENALVWTSGDYAGFDRDSESEHLTSAARCGDEATAVEMEVEEDDAFSSDSEPERENSVLGPLQRFSQGRALLLGVPDYGMGAAGSSANLSTTEVDVAKSLRGHWRPQKF